MPATEQQQQEWIGLDAIGPDGEEVGEVAAFYSDGSGNTEWLAIKSGFLGRKVHFVPADGAEQDGSTLKLLFTKDAVDSAPNVDADGELSEAEEQELFAHYDQAYAGAGDPQAGGGDDGAERPKSGTDERPVTHDENSDLRDPEEGTRLNADEMLRPEHHEGIRPKPGDESEFDPSKEGGDMMPDKSGDD